MVNHRGGPQPVYKHPVSDYRHSTGTGAFQALLALLSPIAHLVPVLFTAWNEYLLKNGNNEEENVND